MANSRQDVGLMLATYAHAYNQRIGQFISNIMSGTNYDIFYVEDDQLVELAGKYVQQFPPPPPERDRW